MSERNREIERIYIEQLRSVETIDRFLNGEEKALNRRIIQCQKKIADKSKELKSIDVEIIDPKKPTISAKIFETVFSVFGYFLYCLFILGIIGLVIGFLAGSISFLFGDGAMFDGDRFKKIFYIVLFVALVIGGILAFIFSIGAVRDIYNEKDYRDEIEKNEKKRIDIAAKKNELVLIKKEENEREKILSKNLQKIKTDRKKVFEFKNSLYSVNWIPLQYRNIRVIYYIYDMVTTSEICIEEALKFYLMQEANNKLDEIIERLDEIIDNQYQMIMNQAVLISQNKELISKNTKMINKLASIEDNTKLAADYAVIGANYSEANAYFSMVTYLKK